MSAHKIYFIAIIVLELPSLHKVSGECGILSGIWDRMQACEKQLFIIGIWGENSQLEFEYAEIVGLSLGNLLETVKIGDFVLSPAECSPSSASIHCLHFKTQHNVDVQERIQNKQRSIVSDMSKIPARMR